MEKKLFCTLFVFYCLAPSFPLVVGSGIRASCAVCELDHHASCGAMEHECCRAMKKKLNPNPVSMGHKCPAEKLLLLSPHHPSRLFTVHEFVQHVQASAEKLGMTVTGFPEHSRLPEHPPKSSVA